MSSVPIPNKSKQSAAADNNTTYFWKLCVYIKFSVYDTRFYLELITIYTSKTIYSYPTIREIQLSPNWNNKAQTQTRNHKKYRKTQTNTSGNNLKAQKAKKKQYF